MEKSHSTHYKEAFKGTWELSAQKEAFVKRNIEYHARVKVIESGFGAGSSTYIKGSSGSHGHEKAAPDFTIENTNIVIEVTGPLQAIRMEKDLFVNISKIKYAWTHPELEYWIAHSNGLVTKRTGVRMIRVVTAFQTGIEDGTIVQEHFTSRGVLQMFYAIPPTHPTVCPFDIFLVYLTKRLND